MSPAHQRTGGRGERMKAVTGRVSLVARANRAARAPGLAGLAGLDRGRFGPSPVHGRVLAVAELGEASGDEVLNLPQVLLVGGLGVEGQRAGAGLQCDLAPAEGDYPVGLGPFGVRLHVRAGPRGTGELTGPLVAQVRALVRDLADVLAEPDEVPARVFGLDAGFGGSHCIPFLASWTQD